MVDGKPVTKFSNKPPASRLLPNRRPSVVRPSGCQATELTQHLPDA